MGVNRGYTVTTGLWARAVLQHQYGVDLSKITWVLSGDEHVAEYRPPANVEPIKVGRDMVQMVLSGELVGAIGVQIDSPIVKPLIPHAAEAGYNALSDHGHYPINHLIVVKDEVLAAYPELGPALFKAFAESKRRYVDQLRSGSLAKPTEVDKMHQRVMAITGADPLPYGLEPNSAMLQTCIRAAVAQGIIDHAPALQSLFPANTHALTA